MTITTVPNATEGWLLDEDAALKVMLSGYAVTNYADRRQIPIKTWFRTPDPEIEERTFPHIQIDLVDIEYAADRAHRAMGFLPPQQETATPATGFFLESPDFPQPWDLIYQLSLFSRDPVHDRQMTVLLYTMFPEQFGQLDMSNWDGTMRRAVNRGTVRRDQLDASNKRTYRNIFTIAVSSEFYLGQIAQIQQILTPVVTIEAGPIVDVVTV
jgi:hypothetical protein